MKTVFNPDEAMRFSKWLEEENAQMLADLGNTVKAWNDFALGWNDSKYNAYMRKLEENTLLLKTFSELADRYIAYLREKARRTYEYFE